MAARVLRKRGATGSKDVPEKKQKTSTQKQIKEESPDELPHNLGPVRPRQKNAGKIPTPPKDLTESAEKVKEEEASPENQPQTEVLNPQAPEETKSTTRRLLRPRQAAAKSSYLESDEGNGAEVIAKISGKSSSIKQEAKDEDEDVNEAMETPVRKTAKKTKENPYGLTPGITPFAEWKAPSAGDCEEVYRRLAKIHGEAQAPEKIPAPSLEVSGCGEVPSVLDALIRTRLSANTSNRNSSAAFRGLVSTFGTVDKGIGKGSVDWNKVRISPLPTIVESIKTGGLAQVKGKDIKAILELVYEENTKRREAFLEEKKGGKSSGMSGADGKTQGQKDLEILKTDQEILSLDHIHGMAPDEAMQTLTKFPGIGVKTASCVILFCLQQPSFAVDTHVHRISGWLKWIPPKATRDQTFSHLEVRIPDHLKYGLHKLFVQHGRSCIRCRANTSEGSEEWKKSECPLDGLMERTGKRQYGGKGGSKKALKEEDSD
ncbi:uncharacterized protein FIESC28_10004 [Fusarium coffeatum]|uniref:HhH-GPD domain-containing protein n=1 Tax=Fusarium coffeatum TaxID=231269 RepID=A0A366QWU3_9HYPO|nr:uncharacterized protein FIESC28_10004 [Fusarium coffeatum]RBR09192.1 hypothetical protein FIESC28_10004 [Fusarium coffeatum]